MLPVFPPAEETAKLGLCGTIPRMWGRKVGGSSATAHRNTPNKARAVATVDRERHNTLPRSASPSLLVRETRCGRPTGTAEARIRAPSLRRQAESPGSGVEGRWQLAAGLSLLL